MKKKVILFIALCLIIKSAPAAGYVMPVADASFVYVGPAVSQVAAVIKLPLIVISGLMEEIPLFNESGKSEKGKKEKNKETKQDTAFAFSINLKEQLKPKLKAQKSGEMRYIHNNDLSRDEKRVISHSVAGTADSIALLFLMCIMFLPRSSIPEGFNYSTKNILPGYPFARMIGFFHLLAKIPAQLSIIGIAGYAVTELNSLIFRGEK